MRLKWHLYRPAEPVRGWPVAAVLVLAFSALTLVTRLYCKDEFSASPFWAPNAALVTAMLILPRRLGAATLATCLALNLAINAASAFPVWQNIYLSALNLSMSLVIAFLARSLCGAALDLTRFRRLATFAAISFCAAGVEALVGVLLNARYKSLGETAQYWLKWALADGLGPVLATPAILIAIKTRSSLDAYQASTRERWLLLVSSVTLAAVAFWSPTPLFLLMYPMLVLTAFRAGPAWVLMSVLLACLIDSGLSVHGHGPFSQTALGQAGLQPYLVTLFLATIPANNALGERTRAAQRLARIKERVEHSAHHDDLTTLANRKLFQRRLAHLVQDHQVEAVLFIDLDGFKQINDTLGHHAGDELLRAFGRRLCDVAPPHATVARFGGDEFAVLIGRTRQPVDVHALCGAILETAKQPFAMARGRTHVSASIGVAPAARLADAGEFMRRADIALYAAKAAGRNAFEVFCEDLDQALRTRTELETDLREALDGAGGLFLLYQPKVSPDGRMTGVEALVRWRHPRHGLLPPSDFLPLAEETGLIVSLGRLVFVEALRFAERWPQLNVAVNVSPVQLRDAQFVDQTLAALDAAGIAPGRMELEVTETALLDDMGQASGALARLRAAGLRIALDDFGTGYSSLNHLHRLAVDRVKVDQSFVENLERTLESAAIVQAIVQLGHAMGLQVTAEGVETDDQRAHLVQAGVDELQGYLFSKPVEEERLAELVGRLGAASEAAAAAPRVPRRRAAR